ncbi:MAG: hypothetical protein FWC89_07635 [Defluviitaleaceae bacterium]|nr:hypothetical protein [Defluviitaleaceae bacterium]
MRNMDNKKRVAELSEEKYQVLFGIRKPTLDEMLAILKKAYKEMRRKGGRKRKLSVIDMLVITLGYSRSLKAVNSPTTKNGSIHESEAIGFALNT